MATLGLTLSCICVRYWKQLMQRERKRNLKPGSALATVDAASRNTEHVRQCLVTTCFGRHLQRQCTVVRSIASLQCLPVAATLASPAVMQTRTGVPVPASLCLLTSILCMRSPHAMSHAHETTDCSKKMFRSYFVALAKHRNHVLQYKHSLQAARTLVLVTDYGGRRS